MVFYLGKNPLKTIKYSDKDCDLYALDKIDFFDRYGENTAGMVLDNRKFFPDGVKDFNEVKFAPIFGDVRTNCFVGSFYSKLDYMNGVLFKFRDSFYLYTDEIFDNESWLNELRLPCIYLGIIEN